MPCCTGYGGRSPAGDTSSDGTSVHPDCGWAATIIHPPQKGQQAVPSHDLTRFYALIPLLAVLAVYDPPAAQALATAISITAGIHQLR